MIERGRSEHKVLSQSGQAKDKSRVATGHEEVKTKILDFYKRLLGTVDENCNEGDISYLRQLLPTTLTEELQQSLMQAVTKEEVLNVINSMPSNESPNPDGFTAKFFKAT